MRGKTILCNCDDPFESRFFKYFALNFNALGLKKLIATSYQKSPIVGKDLSIDSIEGLKPEGKEPYAIEINEVPDHNKKGAIDISDVEYFLKKKANTARSLQGDEIYSGGDFRSGECVELLKQADIVIANPPFSLFREFVTQLVAHDKLFLIIGSKNAIAYRYIFNKNLSKKSFAFDKSTTRQCELTHKSWTVHRIYTPLPPGLPSEAPASPLPNNDVTQWFAPFNVDDHVHADRSHPAASAEAVAALSPAKA